MASCWCGRGDFLSGSAGRRFAMDSGLVHGDLVADNVFRCGKAITISGKELAEKRIRVVLKNRPDSPVITHRRLWNPHRQASLA